MHMSTRAHMHLEAGATLADILKSLPRFLKNGLSLAWTHNVG